MLRKTLLSKQGLAPLFIAIIIGIVAVIITGGAAVVRRPATPAPSATVRLTPPAARVTATAQPTVSETRGTLPAIIGRGQNLECDWHIPTSSGSNPFGNGKLWTSGNKGRSTITATTGGITIEGNAIYMDNTVYTWVTTAGTTVGFKLSQSEINSMNSRLTAQQRQQAEQYRQEMILNCRPWTPDQSKFTLPTGIEFRDS